MSKRKASFVEDNYYTKLEQLLKEEILEADVIFDNYISNRGQINRTFSKALMYFSYLVNRFKSMKVETDVNAFYKTLETFNFRSEDTKKEYSNGRYGLTNLVRTLFLHRKDAENIVGRQLFEGEYTPIGKVIYGMKVLEKIRYSHRSEYVLRPDFINTVRMFK